MNALKGACIIGQSGGPTSVINASAYGVFKAALESGSITRVLGAAHGIKGVLNDRLYDIAQEDLKELQRLQRRVLPVKVGRAVQSSVRENFRRGDFYGGQDWEQPLRSKLGFSCAGGQYGPLLSGSNHLMMSLLSV